MANPIDIVVSVPNLSQYVVDQIDRELGRKRIRYSCEHDPRRKITRYKIVGLTLDRRQLPLPIRKALGVI